MTERDNRLPYDVEQAGNQQSEGENLSWDDLYSFEHIAAEYGIPPEQRNIPAVRFFIEVNRRVKVLQGMLTQEDWGTEPAWARSSGPEGTPSLEQRFLAVSHLTEVMGIFLKDGIRYHNPAVINSEDDRQFLAEKAS